MIFSIGQGFLPKVMIAFGIAASVLLFSMCSLYLRYSQKSTATAQAFLHTCDSLVGCGGGEGASKTAARDVRQVDRWSGKEGYEYAREEQCGELEDAPNDLISTWVYRWRRIVKMLINDDDDDDDDDIPEMDDLSDTHCLEAEGPRPTTSKEGSLWSCEYRRAVCKVLSELWPAITRIWVGLLLTLSVSLVMFGIIILNCAQELPNIGFPPRPFRRRYG